MSMKTGPNISNPMFNWIFFDPIRKGEIMTESIREKILNTASKLTANDRNKTYGPPIVNLTTLADLCNAYLKGKNIEYVEIDAVDAAIFMVLAKVSRIAANRGHNDNYVDGAAYMAIAGECDELLRGTK
jgi:hypothetical protein